ncbi:MAG TPA: Sua5/YciO/YrdC/YwlC family protein [Solirubrobacteraceae bacterium]|jgi:L-threonylcarbamoyladenylate synthase|nr:Sua5/YciO/YrdC/YwlC family protein [Solirubrobacteraceae bacterium]
MNSVLSAGDADRLEECIASGGVAVFPSDTVYGVCCDPEDEAAARRMYELKGRPAKRACAVMFFSLEPALAELEDLGESDRLALEVLLPGPLTLLLANTGHRFAAACRTDPDTLGLRVPRLPAALEALRRIARPVMQSSANLSGQSDARTLADVPEAIREGADLVLDGGELPGAPSTVVDLREFESTRRWHVLREGALPGDDVRHALAALA